LTEKNRKKQKEKEREKERFDHVTGKKPALKGGRPKKRIRAAQKGVVSQGDGSGQER